MKKIVLALAWVLGMKYIQNPTIVPSDDFMRKFNLFDYSFLEKSARQNVIVLTSCFYSISYFLIYYFVNSKNSFIENSILCLSAFILFFSILCIFFLDKGYYFYEPISCIIVYLISGGIFLLFTFICFVLFGMLEPFFGSNYRIITVTDKFLITIWGILKSLFFMLVVFKLIKAILFIVKSASKVKNEYVIAYNMYKKYEKNKTDSETFSDFLNKNRAEWKDIYFG